VSFIKHLTEQAAYVSFIKHLTEQAAYVSNK